MNEYSSKFLSFVSLYRINIACFICVTVAVVLLEAGLFPATKNGFFCGDKSISYPLQEQTISTNGLLLVTGIVSITVISVVEFVASLEKQSLPIWCSKPTRHCTPNLCEAMQVWHKRAMKTMLIFLWYFMVNVIMTDAIKITVGSLRPYFLSACNPNVTCVDGEYHHDYVCQTSIPKDINEARLSFPSGHSSVSATLMGFIMVYFQMRFKTTDKVIFLKPLFHLGMFVLAAWISSTRIADHRHRFIDVISGFILGTVVGVLGGIHATNASNIKFLSKAEPRNSIEAVVNTNDSRIDLEDLKVNSNHDNAGFSNEEENTHGIKDPGESK